MTEQRRIDLRSDTVTHPTPRMRDRMRDAVVGDDVYGEDPATLELEALAAELAGKEAALFVPSGTMGNQLAIMTHTRPGDEIIAGRRSHVVLHEGGAPARLSGVGCAAVDNPDNMIRPEDVIAAIRPDDLMSPPTTLLCLENPLTDGNLVPPDLLHAAARAAHERGLAVHLDGARIFNAATALGMEAGAVAAECDSVMFCLSKGLCAPVGSMLCGGAAFIRRARKYRKLLGGGMRQSGILAAAGLEALETMRRRLHEDHENARMLADLLEAVPGIAVRRERLKINMVFWSAAHPAFNEQDFVAFMAGRGVLCNGCEFPGEYRFVTHRDTDRDDLHRAAEALAAYVESLGRAGRS